MSGFIEGEDRHQAMLFPESLDEYIAEESAVRVIDVFIDDLDISGLGFKTEPAGTGRRGHHPKTMLKLCIRLPEALEQRLDAEPERMRVRRTTSEHPFGTLKAWMGATHFQTRTLPRVSTEMSLHVLAYNLRRVINIMGARLLMAANRSP